MRRIVQRYQFPLAEHLLYDRRSAVTNGSRVASCGGANPEAPLIARSETRFSDQRGPVFEFQLDARGKVTGLILEQGAQRIPLERK